MFIAERQFTLFLCSSRSKMLVDKVENVLFVKGDVKLP